jgi:hypothetical protein
MATLSFYRKLVYVASGRSLGLTFSVFILLHIRILNIQEL